jgi:hypothetical protein
MMILTTEMIQEETNIKDTMTILTTKMILVDLTSRNTMIQTMKIVNILKEIMIH